MHEEVETEVGTIVIESDECEVEVSVIPNGGVVEVSVDGGSATFSLTKRHPMPHDEVTQNGSTFEVLDVRRSGSGYDLLNGNTGVWERWVE